MIATAMSCALTVPDAGATNALQMPADNSMVSARVSITQRIRIASDIRAAVGRYFAHWQGMPANDNFAADFEDYTRTIAATDSRRDFDLATLMLFAHLHNGHTGFHDHWLVAHSGGPVGIAVERHHGRWLIVSSHRVGLSPGDVIIGVNGTSMDEFYADKKRYIAASSARARADKLFIRPFLFPEHFVLTLADGSKATIDRSVALLPHRHSADEKPRAEGGWPSGTYYHAIPSFDAPKYEKAAVAFVKEHRDAKTLVLDLRGNGGGNTPEDLIHALIVSPYRSMAEASAMSVGLLAAYGSFADASEAPNAPRFRAIASAMHNYFERPMMYWPGRIIAPDQPIYYGRLIVLIDRHCASACEDLLMPLKTSDRATLIGETSYGSTGQPYIKDYNNGMGFRVGAKREFFGNGQPFEGVGIQPDIAVDITAPDLKQGRDPILDAAHVLAARGTNSTADDNTLSDHQ
ncbi:S41 family peptidase [Salinisphaera sp. Q1T1-3]|uniref:S41 family peptidase n=1 Tax=Salinisphaera sp. Q1T1-3 TaxID=2321229 RepID=UPI001F2EB916|nr:S41 family peptidase [Salinisphaera sp. Q1T1-3]